MASVLSATRPFIVIGDARRWRTCRPIRNTIADHRLQLVVHHTALETARFVDDALEQTRHRLRPEWTLSGNAAHVRQHFFFALRLIYLESLFLFQAAYLTNTAGSFVQESDEHLVDPVDIASQVVKR